MDRMQKPFDGVLFVNSEAYFIIFWDKKGYFIDVDDIAYDMMAGVKSLTECRAKMIATHTCVLQ